MSAPYPEEDEDFYAWGGDPEPCPTCKGQGTVNPLTAPARMVCMGTALCPDCDGSGEFDW